MQIKALKVQGIGAMVLIMHASEIAEGNYWQKVVAKAAHQRALELRLRRDAPLGGPGGLAVHPPADRRRAGQSMLRAIDRMTPGDMPDFDPSLQMAMKGLNGVKDAMTQAHRRSSATATRPRRRRAVINQLAANKITVTDRPRPPPTATTPAPISVMRNLADQDQGPVLQRHQPQGPAADLPEGGADRSPAR